MLPSHNRFGTGIKMNIEGILAQVDLLFEENRGLDAEKLLQDSIAAAEAEQDDGSLLQLQNEILGYYRETSNREKVFLFAEQAIKQAKRMGLEGTIPYATTLLNVANAYRACGKLQESREYYEQVEKIYRERAVPNGLLTASLKNNMSLLFQELGAFSKAKEYLLEALHIVEKESMPFELGVTYANLASTCMELGETEESRAYAEKSIEIFRANGILDSHYGAALATLGACCYQNEKYREAEKCYREAMELVERSLGRNNAWHRLQERVEACRKKMERKQCSEVEADQLKEEDGMGLSLSKEYYEVCGRPMIAGQFPDYAEKIAVGLVGRGSDCFGFDDKLSRDHDWGPDFCLWVTDETYSEIGKALEKAYEELPREFKGFKRAPRVNGRNRRGVIRISNFYRELLGTDIYDDIEWRSVDDSALAAAVNGKVFRDDEGVFSEVRNRLQQGYPLEIRYLKLADSMSRFSQAAQYNFPRMWKRGDRLTAKIMLMDGIGQAMKIFYYMDNRFPPHDKWLYRGLQKENVSWILSCFERLEEELEGLPDSFEAVSGCVEELGEHLAGELYRRDIISDIEPYLDAHREELVYKASLAGKSREELAEETARLEFEAFDKVRNEGGRASCQNDWPTFSIMRKSQYLTWNHTMLFQYIFDFRREYQRGHNLIEEKYGRMMESTAPEEYEKIREHFPKLSEEKKQIIEQICEVQVGWMEAFAQEYPDLADNARSIHTWEDNPTNTSYETYLRGELGTYSDKMLELYGRYIVSYAGRNRNLVYEIMENSVRMYGYQSLDEAEGKMGVQP